MCTVILLPYLKSYYNAHIVYKDAHNYTLSFATGYSPHPQPEVPLLVTNPTHTQSIKPQNMIHMTNKKIQKSRIFSERVFLICVFDGHTNNNNNNYNIFYHILSCPKNQTLIIVQPQRLSKNIDISPLNNIQSYKISNIFEIGQ